MQASRIVAALVFVVLVGAFPLMAAEPAVTSEVSQAEPPQVVPPADIPGLTPAPILSYGVKYGPCTVSVTCLDENSTHLQCGGTQICYWKLDGFPNRGFVECDGNRYNCPLN